MKNVKLENLDLIAIEARLHNNLLPQNQNLTAVFEDLLLEFGIEGASFEDVKTVMDIFQMFFNYPD